MRIFFSIMISAICLARAATAQSSEVFAPSGIAINGYDPVAFFTESKPMKGLTGFSCNWKNVQWNFISQANLDTFKSSPEKFAPQFGGYCAYGTSQGHKAPTQVDTWTIVNEKLYFNYNMKVKGLWDKNRMPLIDSANVKWPSIKNL
jgi:hypothetical protein